MEQRRIHILCLKPEICSLIKKTLMNSGYNVTCSNGENPDEFVSLHSDEKIECLILDSGIDKIIKDKAKEKFVNASIICLPSLESDNGGNGNRIKNISEPLKLSELAEAVESVFNNKKS